MTRGALVLRPEPGAAATVARLAAHGVAAAVVPLFRIVPVDWRPPGNGFDTLLLTSANAVRHGGAALAALRHLPVVAVGEATAGAARAAGFGVVATGRSDARAAAALMPDARLLHLAGRERVALPGVAAVTVYASDPVDPVPDAVRDAGDAVVLLHSARAARRFAAVARRPAGVHVAAISAAVAQAAGPGWGRLKIAPMPTDAALVATAVSLAIDP